MHRVHASARAKRLLAIERGRTIVVRVANKRRKFFRHLATVPRSRTTAGAHFFDCTKRTIRVTITTVGHKDVTNLFPRSSEIRFDQSAKQFFGNVRKEDLVFPS